MKLLNIAFSTPSIKSLSTQDLSSIIGVFPPSADVHSEAEALLMNFSAAVLDGV